MEQIDAVKNENTMLRDELKSYTKSKEKLQRETENLRIIVSSAHKKRKVGQVLQGRDGGLVKVSFH